MALSAASCVVTYLVQSPARRTLEDMALPARIGNALVSYATYLKQLFYPVGLAPFYPYPTEAIPPWKIAGACLLLLAGITVAAVVWRRRCPYLLVGWLWYLGTLVPVIGLVQVGAQAMADRYSYLTQIGLYVAVAWGLADVVASRVWGRWVAAAAALAAVAVLGGLAWKQASYWRDSETLWTHALDCGVESHVAHDNLGAALADRGQFPEAIKHYRAALAIKSDNKLAHNNLGVALLELGQVEEATKHLREALAIDPDYAEALANLADALTRQKKFDDAVVACNRALELRPDDPKALVNFGNAQSARGKTDEAIACYRQALKIKPDYAKAHNNLGAELAAQKDYAGAIEHYERAIQALPDFAEARYNLGLALAAVGRLDEALERFEEAVQLKPAFAAARDAQDKLLRQRRAPAAELDGNRKP